MARFLRGFGKPVAAISSVLIGVLAFLAPAASPALGERVCDGPGINHAPPVEASPDVLSVLVWNVYLLPIGPRDVPFFGSDFALAQEERAALIPRFVEPFDAVVFAEAFDDDARAILLAGLRERGFAWSTHVLGTAYRLSQARIKGKPLDQPAPFGLGADEARRDGYPDGGEGDIGFDQDGGVLIASRHPILAARELVYESCGGVDCYAFKGFIHAEIDKGGRLYHVIGTHLQSGWDAERSAARQRQLQDIGDYVTNGAGIAPDEAVIIAGDLNTQRGAALEAVLQDDVLRAGAPTFLGHPYTRETRNDWVSRGNGFVDYVLPARGFRAPSRAFNCPLVFRTRFDFENRGLFGTTAGENLCDLSDHYAVWGWLDYRQASEHPAPSCPMPMLPAG
ncbi:MAG: sphingomyelin phosphodiesterase [Alphaproteobacteria bacterium]